MRLTSLLVLLVVAVQLGLVAWHAAAHDQLGVEIPAWRTWFEVAFASAITALAALLMRRRRALAGVLLALASLAALVEGIAYHYVVEGPDLLRDAPQGEWTRALRATGLLLVMTESLLLAAAGWLLREGDRPRRGRRRPVPRAR